MSHHSSELSDEMRKQMGLSEMGSLVTRLDELRGVPAMPSEAFGATGKFPDGKMHAEDEGEIQFGIAHDDDGRVHLHFGKPVEWIAMTSTEAHELAVVLERHAQQATDEERK